MRVLRAFLAHPKSLEEDEELEALRQSTIGAVSALIRKYGGGATPEVVLGREDFNARVLAAGGWDAWADSVSSFESLREDGQFRTHFDLIVVAPDALVGRGTARVVDSAVRRGFPVFLMRQVRPSDGFPLLHPVQGVSIQDPRDFRFGYALQHSEALDPSG